MVISNVEDSDLTGQATMISGSPPAGSDDTQRIASHLGDFTLIRKLGRGAMATVYKAKQISFNRKVALKI